MIDEISIYCRILDKFDELDKDPNKTEIWKDRSIIELMEILSETQKKEIVKNGLLIIMSLFNENLIDTFQLHSKDSIEIPDSSKGVLLSILKEEFNC